MPKQPDLRTLVAARGSIRAVARALGMPEATLRSYVTGRTSTPEGIAAAVRRLKPVRRGRPGRQPGWTVTATKAKPA